MNVIVVQNLWKEKNDGENCRKFFPEFKGQLNNSIKVARLVSYDGEGLQ